MVIHLYFLVGRCTPNAPPHSVVGLCGTDGCVVTPYRVVCFVWLGLPQETNSPHPPLCFVAIGNFFWNNINTNHIQSYFFFTKTQALTTSISILAISQYHRHLLLRRIRRHYKTWEKVWKKQSHVIENKKLKVHVR